MGDKVFWLRGSSPLDPRFETHYDYHDIADGDYYSDLRDVAFGAGNEQEVAGYGYTPGKLPAADAHLEGFRFDPAAEFGERAVIDLTDPASEWGQAWARYDQRLSNLRDTLGPRGFAMNNEAVGDDFKAFLREADLPRRMGLTT